MITAPTWLTWKAFWKVLPYLLATALILFLGSKLYGYIYARGAESVQVKWDEQERQRNETIQGIRDQYSRKEDAHRAINRKISNDLSQARLDAAADLAAAQREFDQRLRNSEARSAVYQRQAQGGAAERGDLAGHAARLDAALEEGVYLVEELQATLGLRERQVLALSEQIKNDRALIEGEAQ